MAYTERIRKAEELADRAGLDALVLSVVTRMVADLLTDVRPVR